MNLSSFFCTLLYLELSNYVSLLIQSNINHLFTQLNDQIVLFETIQFNTIHLCGLSLNIKQFY